jgi:hypothetical protein
LRSGKISLPHPNSKKELGICHGSFVKRGGKGYLLKGLFPDEKKLSALLAMC